MEFACQRSSCGRGFGILAVLYRIAIEYGTKTSLGIYAYLRAHPTYIALWIFVVLAGGLFVAWLVALEPMASGSGIPQVKVSFYSA